MATDGLTFGHFIAESRKKTLTWHIGFLDDVVQRQASILQHIGNIGFFIGKFHAQSDRRMSLRIKVYKKGSLASTRQGRCDIDTGSRFSRTALMG